MAVNRQENFLGQQRVDVPHLRAIESAVCYDFDVVGLTLTAGIPCVISGFEVLNYTTLVGNLASSLTIKTASSRIIHPLASDSGSFFQVPSSRADEVLNISNSRLQGSWTPNTANYLGIDLLRRTDTETVSNVKFLTTNPETETNKRVPLARTLDYVFTISTTPFSISPSICPLYIVQTDSNNSITSIRDARNLLFRNGSGGDSPSVNNPYGWPGTRNEATASNPLQAADRSIKSLKQWLNATMTRIQEIGGGEYWYSLTADRNIKMCQSGTFSSNGESFEWDGTNLHWKGIKFLFDNSTAYINEVTDQTADSSGLTNLNDGECIYVDLDRSTNRTVTGTNALLAQKAVLATLGSSGIPGQRWIIATRVGTKIFVRDQSFPVGSSVTVATTAHTGVLRTTINANGTISDPIAVGLADSATGRYSATCGGVSHNTDLGVTTLVSSGPLVIGRGSSAGDTGVFVQSNTEGSPVVLYGKSTYNTSARAAVEIIQGNSFSPTTTHFNDRIATFSHNLSNLPSDSGVLGSQALVSINADSSISMARATVLAHETENMGNMVVQKMFFRKDKQQYGDIYAIFGVGGNVDLFGNFNEGPTGTWTCKTNGALSPDLLQGVTPRTGMNVLARHINLSVTPNITDGFYTLTQVGDASHPTIFTRVSYIPLFHGVTVYNQATVGFWAQTFITLQTPDPIVADVTPLYFQATDPFQHVQYCIMWSNGTVTPIASGPPIKLYPTD